MADTTSNAHTPAPDASETPRRTTSQSFSDVVTILMRTEPFRDVPLKDLSWLVVPAVAHRQFAIAHATKKDEETAKEQSGPPMPVGLVMWAQVSDEVDRRLRGDLKTPVVKLEPGDWNSGEIAWIMVAAGLPQVLKSMIEQVVARTFPDRPVNIRIGDGKTFKIETIKPRSAA